MVLIKDIEVFTKAVREQKDQIASMKPEYKLWREFLKRSELYKEAVAYYNRYSDKPHLPSRLKGEDITRDTSIDFKFEHEDLRKWAHNQFAEYLSREGIEEPKKDELIDVLKYYYVIFGDVHGESFDIFWERAKNFLFLAHLDSAVNLREWKVNIIDHSLLNKIMFELKDIYCQKPENHSIEGYIDHFSRNFDIDEVVTLSIPLKGKLGPLTDQIKKIIKDQRRSKGIPIESVAYNLYHFCLLSGPIDAEAQQRYLDIYDQRKTEGLKWGEVIPKYIPSYKPEDDINDNFLRQFKADYAKAKKIIFNIESGEYPGTIN